MDQQDPSPSSQSNLDTSSATRAIINRAAHEWKDKGLIDKITVGMTMMALIVSIYPTIDLIWRTDEVSVISFTIQNTVLILVFAMQMFVFFLAKERFRSRVNHLQTRLVTVTTALCAEFHHMNHRKRDLMNNSDYEPRNLPPGETVNALIDYCDSMASALHTLVDSSTEFYVSIKAICEGGSDPKVVTVARDRHMATTHHHSVKDYEQHSVLMNTDFEALLRKDKVVFAADDLNRMSTGGNYHNTSTNWRERYNSTIVVPIRKNAVIGDGVFELVGYITASCKNPNGYPIFQHANGSPRQDIKDLLLGYADSAFGILKRGKIVRKHPSSMPMEKDYILDEDNFAFIQALNREFVKH